MAKREPPKALNRLEIEIDGIVDTISGKMERFLEWMRVSGMSDEAALRRIKLELEGGQMLSELRSFATAKVPGFVGDLTFRFARDSVAVAQKDLNAYQEALAKLNERNDQPAAAKPDPEERTRLQEIVSAYERQGVMIEGADSELPEPPPDADLNDEYLWITVHDQRVCEVCAENHNVVHTLRDWAEIGEPRSGACLGDQNCRCILVPADAVSDEDRAALDKPLVIEK